ncbi:MAG: dienelactone hydrolase family protein [marine benthic group bacterium]|nr:dienelactone hydrolase family protein [Gemmatimonadota bacterium]MCL7973082.1 dienelactone hydrolase family protein [Gemmatimonadota bacterium]
MSSDPIFLRPSGAKALLVFAHGAGAGMQHPFMESVARELADRRIATWRFEFPYMAAGRKRPDRAAVLVDSVRGAVRDAGVTAPDLPLFAGGKSLGGRMTSTAAAEAPLPGVQGIVFLGFPLHRPGDDSDARADHLSRVEVPMLFLQGTRDRLAEIDRIRRVCAALGPRSALHVVDGADHGFSVPKRSGRTDERVREELADAVAEWITRRLTNVARSG